MHIRWWSIIVFFLILSVSSATFFLIQRKSFSSQDVHVVVENADNIASGSQVTFQAGMENSTNVALNNVNLALALPDFMTVAGGDTHFVALHWDTIEPNAKVVKDVSVAIAPNAAQGAISGQADYSPQGFVGRFVASQDFPITPSPLGITSLFDLPSSAVSGQEIEGTLHVIPGNALAINDLWIEFVAPTGFQLEEVSPQFDNASRWRIEGMQKGNDYAFRFRGILHGSAGDEENFQALFEQQKDGNFITLAQNTSSVHISQTVLTVVQTIDGAGNNVVQPGAALTVHLAYQNKSDVPLEDISLTDALTGSGWDSESVVSAQGAWDAASETITWDKNNIPAFALLQPGANGEATFQVSVKSDLLPASAGVANQTIVSDARIVSPHQSLALGGAAFQGEDAQTLKIQGGLSLVSSATLVSSSAGINVYRVQWEARTTLNDISSVRVQASLAPGVAWQNIFSPSDALLSYADNTHTLVWNVGDIPAGTGTIASAEKVSFQVAVPAGNSANAPQIFTDQLIGGTNNFIGIPTEADAGPLAVPGL